MFYKYQAKKPVAGAEGVWGKTEEKEAAGHQAKRGPWTLRAFLSKINGDITSRGRGMIRISSHFPVSLKVPAAVFLSAASPEPEWHCT